MISGAAVLADGTVAVVALFGFDHGSVGAHSFTSAARNAEVFKAHQLGREGLRFRVAAPETAQRATLEEHRSTKAGAVLGGHALNVIDDTGFHMQSPDTVSARETCSQVHKTNKLYAKRMPKTTIFFICTAFIEKSEKYAVSC